MTAGIIVATRTTELTRITPSVVATPAPSAGSRVLKPVTIDSEVRSLAPAIRSTGTATPGKTEPPTTAHHLTPDNIAVIVRSEYAAGLQRCYERYAKDNRNPPGILAVTLHVALTGRVVEYETNPPMKTCDVFASMRFTPEASTDDATHRVEVKITFKYPSVPARFSVTKPALTPHNCLAGTTWLSSESACVETPPAKKKECLPIKDRAIDPFEKDPCRQ
jgi:hypothetical protein